MRFSLSKLAWRLMPLMLLLITWRAAWGQDYSNNPYSNEPTPNSQASEPQPRPVPDQGALEEEVSSQYADSQNSAANDQVAGETNSERGARHDREIGRLQQEVAGIRSQLRAYEESRIERGQLYELSQSLLWSAQLELATGSTEVGSQLDQAEDALERASASAAASGGGDESSNVANALGWLAAARAEIEQDSLYTARVDLIWSITSADSARVISQGYSVPTP